jgi:superfamily II DNA or RNA helicase
VTAVESIIEGFETYGRQLLVAATGAGKTQIFCEVIRRMHPAKSLVLCHREELIDQARRRLDSFGIAAQVEQADYRADNDVQAVVASVQTLMRDDRLTRWRPDQFGIVVADEAHRAMSDSWQKVLRYFDRSACVLGASATPERSDKRNLGQYFENIAYEIGLLDLIRQNWLASIQVKTVPLQIDLDGCRTTAGDYNAEDVGHALEPYLERIASVLHEYRHRKILVFLPLISISEQLARLCRLFAPCQPQPFLIELLDQ